jgi:hypothetical protein
MQVIDAALRRIRWQVMQQMPDVVEQCSRDEGGWSIRSDCKLRTLQRVPLLRHGLAAIFRVSMRGEKVDDGCCCRMVAHVDILAVYVVKQW